MTSKRNSIGPSSRLGDSSRSGDSSRLHASPGSRFGGDDTDDLDPFVARVRRCARSILGDGDAARQTIALCDEYQEARATLQSDRGDGSTVVAVIGPTGQGKSWLVRRFLSSPAVRERIRSGNARDEATEKLTWVGPKPPIQLDSRYESYVAASSSDMRAIPDPYLLVDVPGATDDRSAIAEVARRGLAMSSVLLLVARRDQLRSEATSMLASATEGSVIIPVVNQIRQRDEGLGHDVDAFVSRIRELAPASRITAPVLIDDFEIEGRSEDAVGDSALDAIAERIASENDAGLGGSRRVQKRLDAMEVRFRESLQAVLSDHLPHLTSAVQRLRREAQKLPLEIAESLVGNDSALRAVVRSRFRLSLLTDTAAIFFPYRSQLGLLNLTHGAWDRLLLSLSGSLPSLVSTIYSTTENLRGSRSAESDVRDGLRRRCDAKIADRLGPLARQFERELSDLQGVQAESSGIILAGDSASAPARLSGLDTLQDESQRLIEHTIDHRGPSKTLATLMGLIGTLVFWALMAGPIVALYRHYVSAAYAAIGGGGNLEDFPRPELSLWITSIALSVLPVAILAMMALSIAQRRGRVHAAEEEIRRGHHEMISRLQRDGVLRLVWEQPRLADAEFLLSAGGHELRNSDATISHDA